MARFHGIASWMLNSLGVALLVCSLVLVTGQEEQAQSGGKTCPNATGCDNGCASPQCATLNCKGIGCTCSKNSYDPNCSANCVCKQFGTDCQCSSISQ
jgi:hypothetical protein